MAFRQCWSPGHTCWALPSCCTREQFDTRCIIALVKTARPQVEYTSYLMHDCLMVALGSLCIKWYHTTIYCYRIMSLYKYIQVTSLVLYIINRRGWINYAVNIKISKHILTCSSTECIDMNCNIPLWKVTDILNSTRY